MARLIDAADETTARRAARLAKADLVTGMVGEFPELQGIMGGYYAAACDEGPEIAAAITEHYRPQGRLMPFRPACMARLSLWRTR